MTVRRLAAAALAMALVVSAAGGQGESAQLGPFLVETLRVAANGRVLGLHAEDLDGDGKLDLVAAYATGAAPEPKRALAIWLQKTGRFAESPDQVLDVPKNAAFVDFVDADGDGKRALVFANATGLWARRLVDGKFEREGKKLVAVTGLLALPDDEELPFFDVGRDWDGDGKPEILLPVIDGVAVFTRQADGWQRTGTLKLQPRASYAVKSELYEPRVRNFAARATFVVPELQPCDYDGDGQLDLCAVVEDMLQVHKGGAGPSVFSEVAAARHYLGVRTPDEIRKGAHVHTTVRDLDGDGVADLAVSKLAGGLGQMHATIAFYYGKKGGGFDPPAQVMQREGYAGSLAFADLDGDGKLDLVMPHVNVGLAEMARVLIAKKMRIGWEAHQNVGKRQFSVTAASVHDLDFTVDYSQLADLDGPFPSVQGDFNGDGKPDFVAAAGPDDLGVWLGGGKPLIAPQAKAVVRVPPSKWYQVVDLDGDKRADVLLFYRSRETKAREIVVLHNSGRGW